MTSLQIQHETLYEDAPATAAVSDKVHDLVQVLSMKLDAVWRYDKYIEDCAGDEPCRSMFNQMKEDEMRHVQLLRDQIERLCKEGNFW